MSASPRVAIIGPGRLGSGLARALDGAGWSVVTLGRGGVDTWKGHLAGRDLVLLAVPDDAIAEVAATLAAANAVGKGHVVLHTSGARDRQALSALDGLTAGLGSFAPVQTVADPATAAERLRGAYAVVEGEPAAVARGLELAARLGMIGLQLSAEAKVAYHAGAAIVANLGVALESMAERVAHAGGVPAEAATRIYLPLWQGMVANLIALGTADSLTGPVRRGDVETIRRHLGVLAGDDRKVYVALSREALRIARGAGLPNGVAAEVERVLGE